MSILKRPTPAIAALAIVAIAVAGVLTAETPSRLRASADGAVAEPLTQKLPPVAKRAAGTTKSDKGTAVVLSFDDGTCESGLGVGTTAFATDLVDFDVPTTFTDDFCITAVTTRMNTGQTINTLAWGGAGATPPPITGLSTAPLTSGIAAAGPCPATALEQRAVVQPDNVVLTSTSNFFAGVRAQGFVGRDTNNPAGRMWLLCATCGQTQYSPTTLSGFGLGGNWMIRVTVDPNPWIPVELMDFNVLDG